MAQCEIIGHIKLPEYHKEREKQKKPASAIHPPMKVEYHGRPWRVEQVLPLGKNKKMIQFTLRRGMGKDEEEISFQAAPHMPIKVLKD